MLTIPRRRATLSPSTRCCRYRSIPPPQYQELPLGQVLVPEIMPTQDKSLKAFALARDSPTVVYGPARRPKRHRL